VKCPYCGCSYSPASAHGATKRVPYYSCVSNINCITKCPVGRVNAEALHEAVLGAIEHAAKHQTAMHRMIAQSGGWGKAVRAIDVRGAEYVGKLAAAGHVGPARGAAAYGWTLPRRGERCQGKGGRQERHQAGKRHSLAPESAIPRRLLPIGPFQTPTDLRPNAWFQ